MKRYLITGGCGFIGVNVIAKLASQGASIRVLDDLSLGRREDIEPYGVELVVGDVRDRRTVEKAADGTDVIVHLAAHTRVVESVENPDENFDVNVIGTYNVLRAARGRGVQKVIFASTGGAILGEQEPPVHEEMVPRPISPYGASKLCGEAYLSAFSGSYGLSTVALRFSNVYGPWSYHKGSVIAQFFRRVMQRQSLVVYGDGSQTRDFVFVDDLVAALVRAAAADDVRSEVFQIASARETSVNEVIALMREVTGLDFDVRHEPARAGEIQRNYALIDKARQVLGYDPQVNLKDGLQRTWEWFLSRRKQFEAVRG